MGRGAQRAVLQPSECAIVESRPTRKRRPPFKGHEVEEVEEAPFRPLLRALRGSRDDVRHYVEQSIDLFVHLARVGGRRSVEAVALSQDPFAN